METVRADCKEVQVVEQLVSWGRIGRGEGRRVSSHLGKGPKAT